MINSRLTWYLEDNQLIPKFQCDFMKNRSTIDHLVQLETAIREANIKKEHLIAIFFNIEKMYDNTWRYGILRDLQKLVLRSRLPHFIKNLSERNLKVRIGSTLSNTQKQEEGIPQGSILSVTKFPIKTNEIATFLNPGTHCSLYVDDFVIYYKSKHTHTTERQLQQNINKLNK